MPEPVAVNPVPLNPAGVGAEMTGPEGQFAKGPDSSKVKIGNDGEPIPVGNEAQRRVAQEIAATINPDLKVDKVEPPQEQKIVELEKQLEELKHAVPAPSPVVVKPAKVQAEGNFTPPTVG